MKTILTVIFAFTLVSCGTAGLTSSERKQLKEKQELERKKEVAGLLKIGYYFFDAETAAGQGGSQVTINGEYYGLQVMGDSVASFLPFFGTTQMMIDVYGDSGIKFHSKLEEKETDFNERKKTYTLRGEASKEIISYKVFLEVYENGNASLNISPTNQSSMSYSGKIVPLKLKKE